MAVIKGRKLFCAVKTVQQNMNIFEKIRVKQKEHTMFLFVRGAQIKCFQKNIFSQFV